MIYKTQLKDLIERTLKEYNLYSYEAFQLVYGTIIQESKRGTYIRQNVDNFNINIHAVGIGQTEKGTFDWLKSSYEATIPDLANIKFEELEYNLKYSILFCRLRYRKDKQPIPKTLDEQAKLWKRVYNTIHGKGTVEEYLQNYKQYS